MKPRVLLDIDGVVCDFLTPFLSMINDTMGTNHTLDQMSTWDMYDSFNIPPDIRKEIDLEIKQPGYCGSLLPFPGAIDGVNLLKEVAHIFVVTSPWNSPTWESERRSWVKDFLGIPKHDVISTRQKHVCAGDYLIDDKTETLLKWHECHPDGTPVRWEGPANKNAVFHGLKADNWDSLIDLIQHTWDSPKTSVFRRWRHV